jgi:FkbM family methyltransferase
MLSSTYFWDNLFDRPITLVIDAHSNKVKVSSSYWNDDYGEIENNFIILNRLGIGKIYENYIKFNEDNCWYKKDMRKNILFIGANDMREIGKYVNKYKNGLFIEAIDYTYERLKHNLLTAKSYNTNYIAINSLVTSEKNKIYTFNIFNNDEMSSSIYKPTSKKTDIWPGVCVKETKQIISTTIEDILKEHQWENLQYDVILDVQGAELEVLKGFGKDNLKNITNLIVEASAEALYEGGVLFEELNTFLTSNKFSLNSPPSNIHCDIVYTPIK